jgi:surfeit locus 1 family protein
MLQRMRSAGLIWPTVAVIPALAVLLSLGAWQWQRKAWKEVLVERLETSRRLAPVELASLMPFDEPDAVRFRRVLVRGTFDHAREIHIWLPQDGGEAWRIVTPLRLQQPVIEGGQGRITTVLVIRGRVGGEMKDPQRRPDGQVGGVLDIVGRVRFGSANWATPAPDLVGNRWYALQTDEMRAHASERARDVAALFIEAEEALAPPPAPQPDLGQLTLRNRHFEYALTWWGLALTLLGVYVAFAAGRLQARRDNSAA